jgi:hypothetical protein
VAAAAIGTKGSLPKTVAKKLRKTFLYAKETNTKLAIGAISLHLLIVFHLIHFRTTTFSDTPSRSTLQLIIMRSPIPSERKTEKVRGHIKQSSWLYKRGPTQRRPYLPSYWYCGAGVVCSLAEVPDTQISWDRKSNGHTETVRVVDNDSNIKQNQRYGMKSLFNNSTKFIADPKDIEMIERIQT